MDTINDGPDDDTDLEDNTIAGQEVDTDFVDDAERDAIVAEQEAAKAEGRTALPEADVLRAMREANGEEIPDGTEPPIKDAQKPVVDPAVDKTVQKTDEQQAAERRAEADKEADKLGLKGSARERFHDFTEKLRAKDEELGALDQLAPPINADDKRPTSQRVTEQLQLHRNFEAAIHETGLTPQDFGNVAAFKIAIEGDDPAAWDQALVFIRAQEKALLDRMGESAPADDPLAGFQDLKDAVAGGRIDEDLAADMAKERRKTAAVEAARAQRQQVTGSTQAQEAAVQEIIGFANTQAGAEGTPQRARWDALWPAMEGKLREIQAKHKPESWAQHAEVEFLRLAANYVPAAAKKPATPATPRAPAVGTLPRRGGGSRAATGDAAVLARSGQPDDDAPSSIMAAMNAAIDK